MKNVEKSVGIIAVLSLLLGFSLGQNHRQYLQLKEVEAASFELGFHPGRHHHGCIKHVECEIRNERIEQRLEALRALFEERRAMMESERSRLEKSYQQEMEQERNDVRFEIKDAENGASAVVRILREE